MTIERLWTRQSDFEGTYAFRYIVPSVLFGFSTCIIVGPLLFPTIWAFILAIVGSAILLSIVKVSLHFIASSWSIYRTMKRVTSTDKETGTASDSVTPLKWTHVFIIPNYKEALSVLRNTLKNLASHPNSSEYIIVLAMEAAEGVDAEMKAKALSDADGDCSFYSSFQAVVPAFHHVRLGEARGKASNVNSAANEVLPKLSQLKADIDLDKTMFSIIDADAAVPAVYIAELERAAAQAQDPKFSIYAPPIMFERNWHKVPYVTDSADQVWAMGVLQNLITTNNLAFPASNYAIPCPLVRHIGGWDTNAEAIAEDLHTFLKAYCKTNGRCQLVPLFTPINMMNLQTNGSWDTMKARFTQAERHARAVLEIPYFIRHLHTTMEWKFRHFFMCIRLWDTFVLPHLFSLYQIFVPLSAMLNHTLGLGPFGYMNETFGETAAFLSRTTSILYFISISVSYWFVRKQVQSNLFPNSPKTPSLLRTLFNTFGPGSLSAIVYILIPMMMVSIQVLFFEQGEYIVAEKRALSAEEAELLRDIAAACDEDDKERSNAASTETKAIKGD